MVMWPACLSCVTGICYCWRGWRGVGCCTVLVSEPDVPRPNSTGWVVKNGVLQFLWMNQLALPNILQLLSCKCHKFHWAMFGRHKKWAAMYRYAGMRVAALAASVKMRIVNDAGRCFACSDADQDEVKTTLLMPVMMTMQIDSHTVAGDGVPD